MNSGFQIQNSKFLLAIFLVSSFLFLISYQVLAQKTEQALPQPTIAINPDIYYPLDEILYIEGSAKPNSAVQIQFQKPGAKPVRFAVKSDTNGEWVLAEKVPLESGDWEVRARLVARARGGGRK